MKNWTGEQFGFMTFVVLIAGILGLYAITAFIYVSDALFCTGSRWP